MAEYRDLPVPRLARQCVELLDAGVKYLGLDETVIVPERPCGEP